MDSHDSYEEAIDHIQKIGNEIVVSFDRIHSNDFRLNENISSRCDKLLEKINQQIDWANNYDEDSSNFDKNNSIPVDSLKRRSKFIQEPKLVSNFAPHSIVKKENENKTPSTLTSTFLEPKKNDLKPPKVVWTNDHNKNGQFNPTNTNGKFFTMDQESNYRYSFYDNSSKFSVYLADSKLIEQVCSGFSNESHYNTYNQMQIDSDGLILPDYIENALIHLSKNGLSTVGIFRKSGVKSRINMLKEKIIRKENIEFKSTCVYDVADLVKTWLRDLKPHLLTLDLIDMYSKKDNEFHLWHLNDCHRYLLFVILKFLSIVSSYSQKNQMNTQNLAICFAPSLCEGDNEKQINRAQKCLQYSIENYESLFYLNLKEKFDPKILNLNSHISVVIINASPHDILIRLLHERNLIDKLISRWSISDQTENSDIFEFDLRLSWLLPSKTFSLKRKWNQSDIEKGIELHEMSDLIQSHWTMVPNGKGQTLVKHDIKLELRGLSRKWYEVIFPHVHDQQLKRLSSSFETSIQTKYGTISEI